MQSNKLLLADMFESFCNKCLDIYERDPVQFLSGPGSVWQLCLEKTEYRSGMCHVVHRYTNSNNKSMRDYDQNKKSPFPMHRDANNLYIWTMLQKLPVDGLQ